MTTILELVKNKYGGLHVKSECTTSQGSITLFDGIVTEIKWERPWDDDGYYLIFCVDGMEYVPNVEFNTLTILA